MKMSLETTTENNSSALTLKNIGRNALHYLKRYGSAEIASTTVSAATAEVVYRLTNNETAAAYSATVAGYLTYFGTIVGQEIHSRFKNKTLKQKDVYDIPVSLVKEFGVASYLDFAILRPYILREGIKTFGGSVGGLLGNRVADVPFYALCILCNKLSKKKMKGGNK
jgi:hypothetical protein